MKNVAILGSTGSIGQSTIQVAAGLADRLRICGLSANSNIDQLVQQARQLKPDWIVVTDRRAAEGFRWPRLPGVEVAVGPQALETRVGDPALEMVVAAIVGAAGLRSTLVALQHGKDVALANKEALVAAGPLVMQAAAKSGAALLPVDSEHNAVMQAALAGKPSEIRRIILTASGGPFRDHSLEQMRTVTVADALAHPTWEMGRKITVDSATMMNKALEIIEARWLFGLAPQQIEVMIHPQSIVHSMVEFCDGSVIAQMSPPDMKLPIQYALTYPDRLPGPAAQLDWANCMSLDFEPPDPLRFPALSLGYRVAEMGGTAGAALNAANESAVGAFLKQQISFHEIIPACQEILEQHQFQSHPTIEQIIEVDRWAREEMNKWILA